MSNMIEVTIIDNPLLGGIKNKKIAIKTDDIEKVVECSGIENGKSKIIMKGLLASNYFSTESVDSIKKKINKK